MQRAEIIDPSSPVWTFIARKIPTVAGAYALAGGLLSLAGWVFGIYRLIDWNHSGITMKANTAICSILLGVALISVVHFGTRKVLIRICAGAAALIAFITLCEHITGLSFGIDTLLFGEPPGAPSTAAPGRMGPPASLMFTLLGVSLIFSTLGVRLRRAAGWVAIVVLGMSMLPLTGYFYGASQLYSVTRVTGIALQTATILAAVSVGVLIAIRDFGLVQLLERGDTGGMVFRRLLLPLVFSSFVIGWLRVTGQDLGFYDTAFGTAARTLVEIAVVIGLLWWTANGISRADSALREADRRKDEFIATLSHELRNPLAPIRNAVQLLKLEGPDDPKLASSREMIDRQVTHMTRLIDDLLDVGRITHNKVELRKEVIELADCVTQAVEISRSLIDGACHTLEISLPDEPIYLEADPIRITQILSNLINNACKFTPANGQISLSVEAHDANEVTIRVSDNGLGIDPNRLESVFEMFVQGTSSVDRTQGGLGIGLSLTRQLVELHGGAIGVSSDGAGKGSEFVVKLPRIAPENAPIRSAQEPEAPAKPAKRRILVVDDNIDAAESMRLMIKISGNETEIAFNGAEAVEKARAFRPDTILLDIGLPEMDGYEVCRTLREEPWADDILIVALTGWGQDEDRRRTAEAGFDIHLVKPVDPIALMQTLSEHYEGSENGNA